MENIKEIRTICVNCKFYSSTPSVFHTQSNPNSGAVWYEQFCRASKLPQTVDPVTGALRYTQINDLGRRYFTDQKFDYCRNVNTDGNCPKYEKARESDA